MANCCPDEPMRRPSVSEPVDESGGDIHVCTHSKEKIIPHLSQISHTECGIILLCPSWHRASGVVWSSGAANSDQQKRAPGRQLWKQKDQRGQEMNKKEK
jgi:hypothetical protein